MDKTRIAQTAPPPGFIDLGSGNPALELIPLELLQQAAERYFAAADPRTLQYGAEQGNGYFLSALADFLSDLYGTTVDPGSLLTTAGASSALDMLCTLYTEPGDVIVVEEPSYFLALRIFADHGLRVISIPLDEEGFSPTGLEDILAEQQPEFVYTVPTFHNPASITLTQDRRDRLVELAREHDFLIIADEVYHLLAYAENPPRPFACYAEQVPEVISLNSFSKILAPGLRLGWIQAHPSVVDRLAGCGLLDSGGGMSPFTSAVVRYLIETGDLLEHIAFLRQTYQQRLEVMTSALDRFLPQAVFIEPGGGFFFWVQLPGLDTTDLREKARTQQVDFRPGRLFSNQQRLAEHLRLSFSYYDGKQIEEGISRLGECLRSS